MLGATGMLGHKVVERLAGDFEVWSAVRGAGDGPRTIGGVDAARFDSVVRALAESRPDAVINCVGIIKQLEEAKDPLLSIEINSLFPHRLAQLCRAAGARMIHVSTDCVFSGRKGGYTEEDASDAEDLYGRTKFLGEVGGPGMLTLRTSIVGRELSRSTGLVEWFLRQRGKVGGYTHAIYNGLTTNALADVFRDVLLNHESLSGVHHVSSEPISKFDLLHLLRDTYGTAVEIEPDPSVTIDRTLDSSRFRAATGFQPAPWREMIAEMARDANDRQGRADRVS